MAVADGRHLVLVCGPSRGGKSRWAEHLAAQTARPVLYLATGALLNTETNAQYGLEGQMSKRSLRTILRQICDLYYI